MKIAFFTDVLLPPAGGIEQHVLTTSQALAERGNDVRVYYPGLRHSGLDPESRSRNPSAPDQAKTDKFGMTSSATLHPVLGLAAGFVWPNFSFSFPLYLYFELRKWRPDVIHFQTSGPLAWMAIILSKILKTKLIGTFHSYFMEAEYLGNFGKLGDFWVGAVSRFLWWYVKCVFNNCDLVVSPSEWVANDIKSHGIYKPIKVVHNGADLSEFGVRSGEEAVKLIRDKYNLGENVLLYVGRLSREKGLDTLLKAVHLLNSGLFQSHSASPFSRHPEGLKTPKDLDSSGRTPQNDGEEDCKLLLVGDGPIEGELKKLAGDLGILDNVVFLGRVEHEDLPGSGLFEVSKAFVTASCSENQPLTIIEAMAKGLPIIGVRARGVTELINDNGFLALPNDVDDLSDKIYQLLSNEKERLNMGENSRKFSLEFSLEKVAQNLEQVYSKASF